MGQKSEMTKGQRGLLWAIILIISLTMLILGIVLTIRAVKELETDDAKPDQPGSVYYYSNDNLHNNNNSM